MISVSNAQNSNVNSWIEDIDIYKRKLEENHIDLYHTISKQQFDLEIKKIKESLQNLEDFQVIIELMKLTQRVGEGKGDGHTSIPLWGMSLHEFPIKLFDFENDLRVIKVTEEHKHILGKQLISINDVSIKEVYSKVSKLTPFTENKQSSMDRTCSYMIVSEILNGLNIIGKENEAKFTFMDDKGILETLILKSYSKSELTALKYSEYSILHPEIKTPIDAKFPNLWFTPLHNKKTIVIKFKNYPSEKDMNNFSEDVYNYIQEHKSSSLIIDLRDNYGGDFFMGQILASWLNACDSIKWSTNVYVLVNRKTYSAAMVNTIQFKQILNAKIVGEPTGANPNGYQDMGTFNLPNSKLLVTYTKRLFRFQDMNTMGVQPDILISPSFEDFKNGYDRVLSKVLNEINN